MCVVAVAHRANPHWKLVLAGNRDERHDRPSLPAQFWLDRPQILGGRDAQSGGTWLGLSTSGRFAVVTNRRELGAAPPDRLSRGSLVTDRLDPALAPDLIEPQAYNPFNLFWGDATSLLFLSNRSDSEILALEPGIHGLSNGALHPVWPKTERLTTALSQWLDESATGPERLFDILRDESPLPLIEEDAGNASGIFIRNAIYGTRCSTVVTVDASGAGLLMERSFAPDGSRTGDVSLHFNWPD